MYFVLLSGLNTSTDSPHTAFKSQQAQEVVTVVACDSGTF